MARTFTVYAQGKEIAFSSNFSDQSATLEFCELVWNGKLWSNFAISLAKQANRGYSDKQMAWIHKLLVDHHTVSDEMIAKEIRCVVSNIFGNVLRKAALDEQAEKNTKKYVANLAANIVANVIKRQKTEQLTDMLSQIPNMASIIPLFDSAGTKLQKPKVIFLVSTNRKIKIERHTDGSLSVKDEDYGFSGWISTNGQFHLNSHSSITVVDIQGMKDIVKDPIYYARKYGLGTGHCCFCNRPLCDEFSIAAGYGATCAANRNLPYGKVCLPVKSALKIGS